MKSVKLIALALFICIIAFAQKSVAPCEIYKIIDYQNLFGTRITYDTIKGNAVFDILSFRRHFDRPTLPPALKDTRYKNQTVAVRAQGDTVKDSMTKANWTNTYTYDSKSRVTSFAYSGCIMCNSMPSNHVITYNKQGYVETVIQIALLRDTCKFQYDEQGNITRFDYYDGRGLSKSIIKQ